MKREIEADLQYCPTCMDEYRAEIITCAACQVALVSGKELLQNQLGPGQKQAASNMVISPDDELVTIRRGALVQMKDFQSMLKRVVIPSFAVS